MDVDKNVRQALLESLQELNEDQFKHFKWRLQNNCKGKGNIPRSWLEKAATLDVVDLMCDFYGEDGALCLCIHILEEIHEKHIAAKLKERTKTGRKTQHIVGSLLPTLTFQ